VPFLCRLFSWSLEHRVVPLTFRSADITPLLKKADLDPADPGSYRPISNLSVKLLECLVAKQLVKHLTENNLLPDLQSANHSTETAVLKVVSDTLSALDSVDLAVLALIDLTAAFDTVDHVTSLRRLRKSYGLDGVIVDWFSSYMSGRTQCIRTSTITSISSSVECARKCHRDRSWDRSSFSYRYAADVLQLTRHHQLQPHAYADDSKDLWVLSPSRDCRLARQNFHLH